MNITICPQVLANFSKQIEESQAREKRIVEQNLPFYRVFDWMDDGEFVVDHESVEQYKQEGRYSVTPFTQEENEAQWELCRQSIERSA